MSDGILAVWSDIDPGAKADYTAWYEREHMFERLEVTGFNRARHYQTVSGAPEYFTYYELASPAVVTSPAYLAQSNRSSPWTQRVLPHFRNMNRTAARVVRRVGRGFGAAALTVRLSIQDGQEAALVATIGNELLSAFVGRSGVVAGQLWRADMAATLQPGQDRDLRPGDDAVSDLIMFIEGVGTSPLQTLVQETSGFANFVAAGAAEAPDVATHLLLNGAEGDEAPSI